MLVTNKTSADIYFGPLHLPAGIGQTLTVDDTSETSLYLTNDAVADALNNAYTAAQIDVSGEAQPFPRPVGDPQIYHGSGNPEGLVYAPQGSVFMRRDGAATNGGVLYMKTTGITDSKGWVDLATASGATAMLPPGLVMAFGGTTAPSGWLLCDGSAISRTTYSLLFTAIGTSYGAGDGSTTFNLPDLRGRVPVGLGSQTDVATLGNNDGIAETYRRPQHRHSNHSHGAGSYEMANAYGNSAGSATGNVLAWGSGGSQYAQSISGTSSLADGGSGNSNDSLDAPAWLVLNYIIKT